MENKKRRPAPGSKGAGLIVTVSGLMISLDLIDQFG